MRSWPEFVVVPARRCPDGAELETRHVPLGPDIVLPVFSTVANLARLLGHEQPWVCVRWSDAMEAVAAAGLARVVLDPQGLA